uniref:ATP-dependent Clp protease proteolytic subunit n=2 Tax=Syringa TaxID=24208 RepID=A0A4D5YFP6_9LAMI|nr:ATP-dependent Clp protease proteolytic subunit [Syringa tomentella subsp. yunnanensis]YP_009868627.1 ATP-dependent Clp protease proteolytic subunit [Syringa wolfii]QBS54398.1 ATP-dependent Clp protease proteolytic subunit [Syringa tomentella subsp. yunnanensis]QKG63832.1 ATP-dependent Clp protease proteolytic subunit [Syringa wolfii]UNZ12041.1 ATP-dependent Clp protease proteolytic subunit [Syringa villosa]
MPIGVPKVPFRIPGEEDASWVDVYNRLYRQRVLFLCQEVESEISNQIMGLMVYLSIEDPKKDQYLFINSPGGWAIPGVGIYDTMQFVPPDVHTICLGLAASMGSFILVGGAITKRIALPHARVMIHQPACAFFEAQTGEFVLEMEELIILRENLTRAYVQRTGKPLWVVSEDMERDVFMSATEAQAYGIVDLVAVE